MDAPVPHDRFVFEGFCLDRRSGGLFRLDSPGGAPPVTIGSRALDVLDLLLSRPGELLSKQAIMQAVWPGMVIEEKNLTVQIATLRRVLDDGRTDRSCIQTEAGRGYRFVAPVTRKLRDGLPPANQPAPTSPDATRLQAAEAPRSVRRAPRRYRMTAALAAACVLVVGAVMALAWSGGWIGAGKAPPHLSIAVLPFQNLGDDAKDDYLADAITEDQTTEVSRIGGFFVIGRNSALTYKGKPIDVKRVGEELGVRYAVGGGVRELGGSLRVTAQLISTETGAHLWADRFEVRRDGIGYNVDDIVRQIGWTLTRRIVDTDAARSARERPTNPEVADILLRARSVYNQPATPQRQVELVSLYERALELDPNSATALAGQADALVESVALSDDLTAPDKMRRAEELLKRAELLRPDLLFVMWARVYLLGRQNRCQELMPAAQRTVEAYPLSTGSRLWMGVCQLRMGRAAEAIELVQQAIRIDPQSPPNFTRYRLMGYASLFLDRYDDAVQWLHRSLAANLGAGAGYRSNLYAAIAAAHALAGQTEEARLSAAEAAKLAPMETVRSYFPFNTMNPVYAAQVARMRDGMRLAGIRDHADEDADSGLPSDDVLHTNYVAPTPTTVPGAQTIRTPDLVKLLELRKPLVLDTLNWGTPGAIGLWGRSIPGVIGLWGAGVGGNVSDEYQDRLARKMQQLTGGDRSRPIVAMGSSSERYQGRNLALRLVAMGYSQVYWYRGGREAWQAAGLPDAELVLQDW